MEAVLVDTAIAATDALNGHDFGVIFKAEMSYANWNDEFKDLGDPKIDVVPNTDLPTLDSTGTFEYPNTFDILIRKRFEAHEQEQDTGRPQVPLVNRLIKFSEDVWEFLAPQQGTANQSGRLTLASGLSAAWDPETTKVMVRYVRPHLRSNQFTSWLRIGYTVSKEVG